MGALTAFFLGQLSIVLLFFAFIHFFIFGPPPSTSPRPRRHSHGLLSPSRSLRRKKSSLLRPPFEPPVPPSAILSKTFYNVRAHQPESLDWFNVLVAQALAQIRTEALHDDALLKALRDMLNGPLVPDYVGPITVTELALGEEFPIFSNCRIIPVDEAGADVKAVGLGTRLLARLDVDLSDAITVGVETRLRANWPFRDVMVLPAALTLEVVRFSGTLSLSFIPSVPDNKDSDTEGGGGDDGFLPGPGPITLAFSFLPDYRLDLSVRSLLGSRSRLQDVPKIAQLVEGRIHAWMNDRCVEPRYQQIVLPSIWPRRRNTRGGEADEGEEGVEETVIGEPEAEVQGEVLVGASAAEQGGESDDLETRMAAEGRKLLAAEGRTHDGNAQEGSSVRQRPSRLATKNSTEDLRMPGHFS
jgi:maintenance of morphology protein 1